MSRTQRSYRDTLRQAVIFAMLGTILFISKLVTEALPNIHLIGTLTFTYTLVYREKALIPLYLFVMLTGLLWAGFAPWWIPYLYIWTVLWGMVMLIPKNLSPRVAMIVYPIVCALHGLAYGTLYAPTQALLFGYTWQQTLTWIGIGFYWDILHAVGNFCTGFLIYPLSRLLLRLEKQFHT